jgi:hypothetical protein
MNSKYEGYESHQNTGAQHGRYIMEVLIKECGVQMAETHQYIESEGTSWSNTDFLYPSDSLHKIPFS